MGTLEVIQLNLFSPMVLAFVLGIIATLVRSDLRFPDALYTALSIYLLLAIGLKGGAALSETPFRAFLPPAAATLIFGVTVPLWCYAILRKIGRFDVSNAAALAAHYGSVSAVTFIACITFLDTVGEPYEGFMPTLVALLEVPAIIVGILIARARMAERGTSISRVVHEVVAGRSILLLLGGLAIGFMAGRPGVDMVSAFFIEPFNGALTLFLLEMGMVAAKRFGDLKKVGGFLIGFGIIMPLIHGVLGVVVGSWTGLSIGGCTIFAVLVASASYIAAPAAVRIALPQANPGYYLTAALAITFPFNIIFGIPIYYAVAGYLLG